MRTEAVIVLGLDKGTVKMLAELPEIMKEAAVDELNNRADLMRDLAKVMVRVETGSLRDSIRKERYRDVVKVRAGGYIVNPKTGKLVDYAVIIEQKYPYMRPAWNAVSEGIEDAIIEKVRERIRQ